MPAKISSQVFILPENIFWLPVLCHPGSSSTVQDFFCQTVVKEFKSGKDKKSVAAADDREGTCNQYTTLGLARFFQSNMSDITSSHFPNSRGQDPGINYKYCGSREAS
jgi:hypothetical protein